jgi:hypothetical protein
MNLDKQALDRWITREPDYYEPDDYEDDEHEPDEPRCADCGEWEVTTGHMECQYPQDHE